MISRTIKKQLNSYITGTDNKILFIWGPRRSGKTTLLKEVAQEINARIFNFDYIDDRELFVPTRSAVENLVDSTKGSNILLIDEVQNYPQATIVLKLLHDEYNIKIIATGSSELRQTTNDFDTLAGRYIEIYCLPLSINELVRNTAPSRIDKKRTIENTLNKSLIYGTYPEICTKDLTDDAKQDLLKNIVNTYVLKDVVNIYKLKDLKLAKDILTKIALQIGSEVSLREIATSLQANVGTISNYIEIFTKNYILITVPSFKTNKRRAVSDNKKYYFLDLGIRNSLINDFRDLDKRQDKGALFENYIVSEACKIRKTVAHNFSIYFYREYNGREVDLVLESFDGKYRTIEIKFSKHSKLPKNVFPIDNKFEMLTQQNFYSILESIKEGV